MRNPRHFVHLNCYEYLALQILLAIVPRSSFEESNQFLICCSDLATLGLGPDGSNISLHHLTLLNSK